MRIVAKIPYKNIDPQTIEKLEHNASFGYNTQVILDAATEQVLLVF
jgi:hypothetical protein